MGKILIRHRDNGSVRMKCLCCSDEQHGTAADFLLLTLSPIDTLQAREERFTARWKKLQADREAARLQAEAEARGC